MLLSSLVCLSTVPSICTTCVRVGTCTGAHVHCSCPSALPCWWLYTPTHPTLPLTHTAKAVHGSSRLPCPECHSHNAEAQQKRIGWLPHARILARLAVSVGILPTTSKSGVLKCSLSKRLCIALPCSLRDDPNFKHACWLPCSFTGR